MDFEEAVKKALMLRDERDWVQFHNPKDLAISISLEAAELLEVFQWSGTDLEVADRLGVNLVEAVSDKIDADRRKYPVDKSRGNSKKYSEL